ncbi:MAG: hypothetical protein AAF467_27315 [Actinomycetota bacterium]
MSFNTSVIVERPGVVDTEPRRIGALRRYGPWLLLAVRMIAALWPVVVPLTVAMFVAGPLGFVVALVLVGLGLWRSARYRRLVERSRVGVLTALVRHQWPSICSLCGFTVAGDRRARHPDLAGIEFGPGWLRQPWWRVELIPLAQHDEPAWWKYGTRLQRQLKFVAHEQIKNDGDGSVSITLARNPLPKLVPASRAKLGRTDVNGRDLVLLAVDVMGTEVIWTPDDDGRGMIFIGGTQGGGKTNIIRLIVAHGLQARLLSPGGLGGWDFYVIDPAGVDFAWLDGVPGTVVATDPVEMFRQIFAGRDEIDRRSSVMQIYKVNHWLKLPLEVRHQHDMARRLVIVVDELVALMAMRGRVMEPNPTGKGRDLDLFGPMAAALADLGAMGRKVGVSVVAATQHPIGEHLGPMGSTFKANLGARIGTGALEAEGGGALFGKSEGAEVAAFLSSRIPGRCVTRGLSAEGTQSRRHGQALFVPDDLLHELAADARAATPDLEAIQ